MSPKGKKRLKQGFYTLLLFFVVVNAIAAFHAWKFTHFKPGAAKRTGDESTLSFTEKMEALFLGVSLPRPGNKRQPDQPFKVINIESNKKLQCWMIRREGVATKGTVILFHGYGGAKASMLDKSEIFRQCGYNTLLVDFMGAGESEGAQCTLGYMEAREVADCVNYVARHGEQNIVLFGSSMGAAAIMKAMSDSALNVRSIILECPYATMMRTVENRFKTLGVPPYGLAQLLVFWGGVENGFNAFSLKPEAYAKNIHCPALLIWGEKDPKVAADEIDTIYSHLAGPKQLMKLPEAGHNDYLLKYRTQWVAKVDSFLRYQ